MKEKLNSAIQFWAAALTVIQLLLATFYFSWQSFFSGPSITGSFKLIPPSPNYYSFNNRPPSYKHDTVQLKYLNQFLEEDIPLYYITFNNFQQKEYMLDTDRINCKKAENSLERLSAILCGEPVNMGFNFGSCYQIQLYNGDDKPLKDIKVDLFYSIPPQSLVQSGYQSFRTPWLIDSLTILNAAEDVLVKQIAPHKLKTIYTWASLPQIPTSILVSFDGGSKRIYLTKEVYVENSFDNTITDFFLDNSFVQLLVYFLTPLGLIFFVFFLIPKGIPLLKRAILFFKAVAYTKKPPDT
jgi:hypothetical protein